MNWLSVVRLLTAPGAEHTVGAPVSWSEGNAGPVWWDVEPTVLHLFPLMGSASPLQVCISLIKKCLCASCLPSARFIIKVSWWENKRFGGIAAGLLGLPIYEAAFMSTGAPAAVPVEHMAICLQRVHTWSNQPGLLPHVRVLPLVTSYTYRKLHICSFLVSHAASQLYNPFNSLMPNLSSPFTLTWNVFTQSENKPPYTNARHSNLLHLECASKALRMKRRVHSSLYAIVNLAALEMFTWTSSVILSMGVGVPLKAPIEWRFCKWKFSTWWTFLAPFG